MDPVQAFGPPKKLKATVTLTLPEIDADAQVWQSYDPNKMAEEYKKQLQDNLIEQIEGPFEDDTLIINAEVEVV